MADIWGGIEAGGTKFICAIGTEPGDVRARKQIDTTTPQETLAKCIGFFRENAGGGDLLAGVGIGSFGPLDPNPASPTFGYITSTPKPGWANTDFAGTIGRALGVPVAFDTDVNAAGLGEHRWGAARELDTFIYLTIGTGIGGGGLANGKLMHGLVHPEMGHIRIPHDVDDPYPGYCPYHRDCLEGLAAGPAIEGRWGQRGETLPPDHRAWLLEAHYLALGLMNLIVTLSPQRVIMGGGVMAQPGLLARVRAEVQKLLNGYIKAPAVLERIDQYIVAPALGKDAGVLGAIALAEFGIDVQGSEFGVQEC